MEKNKVMMALMGAALAGPAFAQMPDMELLAQWQEVKIVHYEATGVIADKHVTLPPGDVDLYGDVVDQVTLSFDWDRGKHALVGAIRFQNLPAKVTNLVSIEKGCPVGSLSGPYEHFDIVEAKASKQSPGTIELVGKRIHPDTLVKQACGSKATPFKGGVTPRTEYIAPPDPIMFAMPAPNVKTIKISPDKKSIIMTALNNNWTWTFTPTAK